MFAGTKAFSVKITLIAFVAATVSLPKYEDHVELENEKIIELMRYLCTRGKVAEVGLLTRMSDHHNSHAYCRQPATMTVAGPDGPQKQTIISKLPSGRPRTSVYVIPPNITHHYTVEIVRHHRNKVGINEKSTMVGDRKPVVHFLKNTPLFS